MFFCLWQEQGNNLNALIYEEDNPDANNEWYVALICVQRPLLYLWICAILQIGIVYLIPVNLSSHGNKHPKIPPW